MTDQLVSFETAKLAKGKGFKVSLDIGGNCNVYNKYNSSEQPSSYHVHFQYPNEDRYLSAPTQSLLQKWLREKYNIQMFLHPYSDNTFACDVIDNKTIHGDNKPHRCNSPRCETYEEALEIGLQEALKLI